MKLKAFAVIAALTAALLLPACGQKNAPEKPAAATEAQTQAAPETASATEAPTLPTAGETANPLTGQPGYDAGRLAQKAVGIVVENTPAARPQWGMTTPDMIVEYEVEGGISRLLWLYADLSRVPENVGPVRSARHDVAELARGWDLLFVHCGGSPEALALIKTYGGALSEIDAMTDGSFTHRDETRDVSLEHRLVLTGTKLADAVAAHGIDMTADPAKRLPFSFADAPRALTGGTAETLHFAYSAAYVNDFILQTESGKYLREVGGSPMTDENGTVCLYDNVLVLYVEMQSRNDEAGHQDLLLENGGEGLYVSGGKCEAIRWAKDGEDAPLRLLTPDGQPLTLNPGVSYLGLVRSTQKSLTTFG